MLTTMTAAAERTAGERPRRDERPEIQFIVLTAEVGLVLIAASERGVCSVRMGDDANALEQALRAEFPDARIEAVGGLVPTWARPMERYLGGEPHPLDLPLDVEGTSFERRVWDALRVIPFGSTRSYGDIARSIGRPTAARAVAGACARNPVALVVPCHRVVRESGDLGGYRWGVHRKAMLLEQERLTLLDQEQARLRGALEGILAGAERKNSASEDGSKAYEAGTLIAGRYSIRRVLGEGGMGVVYLADDAVVGEPVALKVLHERASTEPGARERFTHELRLTRRISNPHVVRTHDLGDAAGLRYITMEWVDGCSLRDVLREGGPLSPEVSVIIARQLCRALDAVHRLDVVHRDIKPENVLFSATGRLVLSDFGIAGLVDPSTLARDASDGLGTLAYMAPEQLLGEPLDERTDLYAVGALLHECLTGRPPFEARTPEALLALAFSGADRLTAAIGDHVAPQLASVIIATLSTEPSRRPATAVALHDALAEVTMDPM